MTQMTQVLKYKKKPVVVEAMQFEYSAAGIAAVAAFCGKAATTYGKDRHITAVGWVQIRTLEDGVDGSPQVKHIAKEGDYIIKGVQGEFYPVKPDIFAATYEPA